MRTLLEWKNTEELPEKEGEVLVYIHDSVIKQNLVYQTKCYKNKKVTFSSSPVLAWCYFDTTVLDNNHFDKEWIEKLHNNAVKH